MNRHSNLHHGRGEEVIWSAKSRERPMIQDFGNACERTTRQAKQVAIVLGACALVLLWILEAASQHQLLEVTLPIPSTNHPVRLHTLSPPPSRPPPTQATPEVNVNDARSEDDCDFSSARDVVSGIAAAANSPLPADFPSPHATRAHYDAIVTLLQQKRSCLKKRRDALSSDGHAERRSSWFFDLGSRAMDQTEIFLRHFPSAKSFAIACFEANPKFNPVYGKFVAENQDVLLRYFNLAVGVENTTLLLSDANVGSSIVREGAGATKRPGDVEVRVVDFASIFLQLILGSDLQLPHGTTKPLVVMKMDIEKMEFAVLHRLIVTGAFLFVDDLLLECHYNTNLPRSQRDASKHLGLDDCVALVALLNDAFQGGERVPRFEAVLWNSKRTAKSSGYSARHGGFFPS